MSKKSRFIFATLLMGTLTIDGVASAAMANIESTVLMREANRSKQVNGG